MACVVNPPVHGDSEREEGEIVDELDDLSDISSEEEFLLRQRLHMLEKYNNVLERKNAKRTVGAVKTKTVKSGKNGKNYDELLCDLSEISATELEEPDVKLKNEQRNLKSYHKPKRRKDPPADNHLAKRVHRKKSHKYKKKPVVLSESSDESDDEYRNKRRKLANAVAVNKTNVDKTSLKARLEKMFCVPQNLDLEKYPPILQTEKTQTVLDNDDFSLDSSENINFKTSSTAEKEVIKDNSQNTACVYESVDSLDSSENINFKTSSTAEKEVIKDNSQNTACVYESVDLCSDVDTKDSEINGSIVSVPSESHDTTDSVQYAIPNTENVVIKETQNVRDSDEDLELLREHALKTKTVKTDSKKDILEKQETEQKDTIEEKDPLLLSEDEDSDTAELRLICLKSALLKKAIEMKRKQKLRKRLSQSSNLNDELMKDQTEYMNPILSENNTDIESVDMDIGSDGDDKSKDFPIEPLKPTNLEYQNIQHITTKPDKNNIHKEDEFEEDEDLLRAKLLTSLSKNLPNLVDPNVIKSITDSDLPKTDNETENQANNVSEEKRFIISLGNSDSEGEHEATKNLTKMHIKLSEQVDFQQKLDMFLKSTRMEVEKSALPDVVQQPPLPVLSVPKPKEKFVPKTVKHLPKSEQIEYKNLVKRMAELEKIKNTRQSSIHLANKGTVSNKETLKPHNFGPQQEFPHKQLEEQIALSRKTIAEESAKVLKLKEEANKLSQKYKIVATELRNIATAITFNKKEQRAAQIKLSKIRAQHQLLINSSTTFKHSMPNGNVAPVARGPQKTTSNASKRPQKENAPAKEEGKTVQLYRHSTLNELQSVKVSVVNDRMEEPTPRLSIQVDVTSNKKTVKIPNREIRNSLENNLDTRVADTRTVEAVDALVDRGEGNKDNIERTISNWGCKTKVKNDDYKSPLQALGSANWVEDPNSVLCRFEVGGNCKDPDCKFLHPKTLPDQ